MTEVLTPSISILIVSFNTRAMTLACLDSIVAETSQTPYEIIVVDNASTDGSAEAIGRHHSRPKLLALDTNVGFAQGNNLAAEQARGEYLLLLNPDTVVLDHAIDRLMAFARLQPAAQIWGGKTVFADGSLNRANAWGRMTLWNLACRATGMTGLAADSDFFNGEAYGGWQRDTQRAVDIVSGCFLLLPRSLWQGLGGFDPAYFMYGEEADLCLRARRAGARPRITPDAVIVHYGGASETARESKMVKLLTAKATLIRRHFMKPAVPVALALLAAWPLSRWIALGLLQRVRPAAARVETARTWAAIWRRRSEWLPGYHTPSSSADFAQTPSATPA